MTVDCHGNEQPRVAPARHAERGFSLLESLIAMTVLSIGLLGLAAMQTMALSRNVDAQELTTAANLAAEMVERIHFNRANVANYNGALGTGIDTSNAATQPPAGQPTARGDYNQWQASLGLSGLDNARGTVNVTTMGPAALSQSQVVVRVVWSTKAQGEGDNVQKLSRTATVTLQSVVTPP